MILVIISLQRDLIQKVNVVNYDHNIEIDAAIPGMTKEDVDVENYGWCSNY